MAGATVYIEKLLCTWVRQSRTVRMRRNEVRYGTGVKKSPGTEKAGEEKGKAGKKEKEAY